MTRASGATSVGIMPAEASRPPTPKRVLRALDRVLDPELDEPITRLRFVSSCRVAADGDVEVVLRLPTPQCAPNFAFLMAADAREAVRALPGVGQVTVRLEDHYTSGEINSALARGEGFTGAFPGETDDDRLANLRKLFSRKALTARQTRLCRSLLEHGASVEEVVALRVWQLPDVEDARRCLELRRQLGLAADLDSPAFLLGDGRAPRPAELDRWLRAGRLVATSLETNGGICRSLLQFRHALPQEEDAPR